jgi:hypothetical protein
MLTEAAVAALSRESGSRDVERSGAPEIAVARDLSATLSLLSGCESSQVALHAQRHEHRVETEK